LAKAVEAARRHGPKFTTRHGEIQKKPAPVDAGTKKTASLRNVQ
jgi:hypothetical protein